MAKRTTGIGGIFLRIPDPAATAAWYAKHLDIVTDDYGNCRGTQFTWGAAATDTSAGTDASNARGMTIWSLFPKDTEYFGDVSQAVMINYRVADLDALLATLRSEGVWVDEKMETSEYGKFGWIKDNNGNRIELWQPPTDNPDVY